MTSHFCGLYAGFPQRLENLENENGHGKVMKHEKWAKVMEFCDQSWNLLKKKRKKRKKKGIVPNLYVFCNHISLYSTGNGVRVGYPTRMKNLHTKK